MSTAKSMANQYLSAKRAAGKSSTLSPLSTSGQQQQYRFKSSTSNLLAANSAASRSRSVTNGLKATSMTNLLSEHNSTATRLQRPASRNALDSIHNGMNAKYAQVQSKVLLQNIRPQQQQQQQQSGQQTRIPASKTSSDTLSRRTAASHVRSTPSPVKAPNERSAMINKLKSLQEELDKGEQERESIKAELEQERTDKQEQVQQLKLELQEKIAEHDKQNEEYHQKLLEAYELADQNRRAADQVLTESRQRAEESRKKVEELEAQLAELKEFVSMKEEMTDKMYELREQIREERQRYEEQLKSLHQVFENEKIRLEADLVEKVRQVGEHYELNRYKTLNKTIELDARLANERLLATKLRLNQVNSMNDKLMKQLRSLQQDFRSQEKKLLLTETMLRQLIDTKDPSRRAAQQQQLQQQQQPAKATTTGSRVGRAAGRLSKFGRSQTTTTTTAPADGKPSTVSRAASRQRPPASSSPSPSAAAAAANYNNNNNDLVPTSVAATGLTASDAGQQQQHQTVAAGGQVSISSQATQTQTAPSRTRTIINDLRQRLNLAGNSSKAPSNRQPTDNGAAAATGSSPTTTTTAKGLLDEAVQTQQQQLTLIGDERSQLTTVRVEDLREEDDQYIYYSEEDEDYVGQRRHLLEVAAGGGRRRSISLNDILATSFVHEAATGEQIIVSRGWPVPRSGARRRVRSSSSSRHPQVRLRSRLNETQKRRLLMQFLGRQQPAAASDGKPKSLLIQSGPSEVRSAMRLTRNASGQQLRPGAGRRASILKLNVRRVGSGRQDNQQPPKQRGVESKQPDERLAATSRQRQQQQRRSTTPPTKGKSLTVQYDLPASDTDGRKPLALGN